jgi:hypothetical protein
MAIEFVVEDGTGKSDATSYCTIAEFKQYWENRGVDYTAEADVDIQAWLNRGTAYIDQNYDFCGERTSDTQALDWPRQYLTDRNGNTLASDAVPTDVKNATNEMAREAKSTSDLNVNSSIKSKKVGVVSVTYGSGVSIAYPSVSNYLNWYTLPGGALDVYRV